VRAETNLAIRRKFDVTLLGGIGFEPMTSTV
jgi:hypothetical protein